MDTIWASRCFRCRRRRRTLLGRERRWTSTSSGSLTEAEKVAHKGICCFPFHVAGYLMRHGNAGRRVGSLAVDTGVAPAVRVWLCNYCSFHIMPPVEAVSCVLWGATCPRGFSAVNGRRGSPPSYIWTGSRCLVISTTPSLILGVLDAGRVSVYFVIRSGSVALLHEHSRDHRMTKDWGLHPGLWCFGDLDAVKVPLATDPVKIGNSARAYPTYSLYNATASLLRSTDSLLAAIGTILMKSFLRRSARATLLLILPAGDPPHRRRGRSRTPRT